jgi:hypothetical protein
MSAGRLTGPTASTTEIATDCQKWCEMAYWVSYDLDRTPQRQHECFGVRLNPAPCRV